METITNPSNWILRLKITITSYHGQTSKVKPTYSMCLYYQLPAQYSILCIGNVLRVSLNG